MVVVRARAAVSARVAGGGEPARLVAGCSPPLAASSSRTIAVMGTDAERATARKELGMGINPQ
jgi:hypothetical protein